MFLSIIIAAYNAAKTIGKTLASIEPLLSDELEVVVVNDGSTDDTQKIIDCYEWVITINQYNKGVSAARNAGIGQARGKYLWFVDADDYMDAQAAKSLLDKIRNQDFDFVWFANMNVVNGQKRKAFNMPNGISDMPITTEQWRKFYQGAGMLWQYWLRRDIIIQQHIHFIEWAKWFEDTHFLLWFTSKTHNVYISSSVLYYYVFNPQGAMRNSLLEDRHKCSIKLSIDLLNRGGDKPALKFIKKNVAISMAWCIREAQDSYAKELYDMCKNAGTFPLAISGTLKQKIQISLLNTNFTLYRLFCKLI